MQNEHAVTAFTPRLFQFQCPDHSKYWLDGSPIKTYYANALAILIPSGEKYFIQSIRPFMSNIHCPLLKNQLTNFIHQEANHSREYQKFLQQHIYAYYPDLKVKKTTFPILGLLSLLGGKKMRLALTVIAEHFTAVVADVQLNHPESFAGLAPEIAALWQWHCIEEIEHKAVAFDVLKYSGYPYALRLATFAFLTPFILWTFVRFFWKMMKKDKHHGKWQFYKENFAFIKKNANLFRQGIKQYFAFIKPHFHPWQHDNRSLIAKWEKTLAQIKQ